MKRIVKIVLLASVLGVLFSAFHFAYSPIIGDEYPQVYDLYWNNRTARWSVDGRAHKYEERLYRDGRRVNTKTQTSRSHNFSSEMARGDHEYYFEVRPYNNMTGWGNWEQSESIYIESSGYSPTPVYPVYPVDPSYPQGGPGEGTNVPAPQTIYNPVGQWVAANGTWHFLYSNGVYATNSWIQLGNSWYYVDQNTNMATGLVTINSKTFFFNPDGTMVTGTVVINGITHFFDANGVMLY